MELLDKIILEFIARNTIATRRTIDTNCLDGGSSNNALNRLVRDGLIQRISNGLDGNYSYYQLTQKGARLCNVPQNRARPKDARGLALELAALWFSSMGEKRRKRLNMQELKTLFGAPKGGNVIHVAQDGEDEETTVFRVFAPGATALLRAFLPTLKRTAFEVLADEKILRWAERGTYQFAVLVHSDDRKEDLAEMIRNEEFPEIRLHLDVVPTPSTLRQFMTPEKEGE